MEQIRRYQPLIGLAFIVCLMGCNAPQLTDSSATTMPTPSPTFVQPMATNTTIATPTRATLSTTVTSSFTIPDYRQAMQPEFAAEVDAVQASGATQYNLTITIPPDSFQNEDGVTFQGMAEIHYTNTETVPLTDIYFRLYPNLVGFAGQMQILQVWVADEPTTPRLDANDTVLKVPLPKPLVPQESIDLALRYSATAPTTVEKGYNIFSYTNDVLAMAGFYPAVAVYDEGWNTLIPPYYGDATFHDIALYQVTLTVPDDMVVVASGNQIEQQTQADGTKTLQLISGPIRDFYMAMSNQYQVISDTVDGITVNSYYLPTTDEGAQQVLTDAVEALQFFNKQFGPYPYTEFDLVATPTRAGGVEYPGVVVIAQGLYHQPTSFTKHVVGHEVAHQWWYGLVGNNQITEPWLDEALTQYSTLLFWEATDGAEVAAQINQQMFVTPYEQAKAEGKDLPVAGTVADFDQTEYAAFVYAKGPLFFKTLHEEVGDEIFYEIMQNYYTEYKYKLAQADDFVNIAEKTYGQSIAPLYNRWILGQ